MKCGANAATTVSTGAERLFPSLYFLKIALCCLIFSFFKPFCNFANGSWEKKFSLELRGLLCAAFLLPKNNYFFDKKLPTFRYCINVFSTIILRSKKNIESVNNEKISALLFYLVDN